MAAQADAGAAQVVDPQLVANSFVDQYYKVLHDFPDLVHRFYQDSSILGRPGPNGIMTSISTINAINEEIISMDYHHLQTEILTVDAQGSYCSGVIVLVIGFLTEKDNVKRKFAQSFFLAPQEMGFFVLNDVFRYVDDHNDQYDHHQVVMAIDGGDQSAPTTPLATDSEPSHAIPNDQSILINHETATSSAHEDHTNNGNELEAIVHPSIMQNRKPNSTESSVPHQKLSHEVAAHPVTSKQADTDIDSLSSKKSFASIVNALKDNCAPFKGAPPKPVERSRVASAFKPSAPTSTSSDIASKRHDNNRPAGSDSTLKPTPVGYENNNYKVTSNGPVGYQSNNYRVTSNGRNPPVTTARNATRESTKAPQKEGGRRVAYQAKV
ncbi:hypothetical protein LWI28_023947 [Acer negundo]|uniref:NTF2 domain-containing protein n=1 Tax=Acer negundo TaxID=4023 RepID=A0AAD5IBG2_ACENE|nr:hypothetical protein LWI28_023947 [Acer negundo]